MREHVARQAFGGEQVAQLAVFVELGVVGAGHVHQLGLFAHQIETKADALRHVFIAQQRQRDLVGQIEEGAGSDLRADGQLAAAAIDQHRQIDARRTAEVEQLVHRCADGATGVQHVVDEQHGLIGDGHGQRGAIGAGVQTAGGEVVAVKGRRHHAVGLRQLQVGVQPLRQPGAAGIDADEQGRLGLRRDSAANLREQLGVERLGVWRGGDWGSRRGRHGQRCCRYCSTMSWAAALSTSLAPSSSAATEV